MMPASPSPHPKIPYGGSPPVRLQGQHVRRGLPSRVPGQACAPHRFHDSGNRNATSDGAAPPRRARYVVTGTKILELCQKAHSLYVSQERHEQRRLLNTLLSNCTFDRGTLTPTYSKPFGLLAEGNETEDWLGGRDSNPDYTVQSRVSYH